MCESNCTPFTRRTPDRERVTSIQPTQLANCASPVTLQVMLRTSSCTGNALLRAVLCAPADDAPRLILADWLDENGDEARATLIRRMCRMPSYTFTWSRWTKRGRHQHNESMHAIRGLRTQLAAMCHAEWMWYYDVSRIVVRRGFAESITMGTRLFLRSARAIFLKHPIQHVTIRDLGTMSSFDGDEFVEARLVHQDFRWEEWPAQFYPEKQIGDRLIYRSPEEAMADFSRRAAAYGRRVAEIPVEPPPLPVRRARQTMLAVALVGGEG
jgi:uncharacterized protein (TIGR02996 family)